MLEVERYVEVQEALRSLTTRQMEVLDLTVAGYTQREQAALLGVTQQAVSRTYRQAVSKLQEMLQEGVVFSPPPDDCLVEPHTISLENDGHLRTL